MTKQEKQLLTGLINKDRQAAKEFYDRYAIRLSNFISGKIAIREDAEELTQDVIFAFLDNLNGFSGTSSINTYLCSIANNKIIDYYRKQKIKKIFFSQLTPFLQILTDDKYDPEQLLEKTFLKQRIKNTFSQITPKYAKIIWLKYVEGRSIAEIAMLLKITFKAAESRLIRARRMFSLVFTTK